MIHLFQRLNSYNSSSWLSSHEYRADGLVRNVIWRVYPEPSPVNRMTIKFGSAICRRQIYLYPVASRRRRLVAWQLLSHSLDIHTHTHTRYTWYFMGDERYSFVSGRDDGNDTRKLYNLETKLNFMYFYVYAYNTLALAIKNRRAEGKCAATTRV